MRSITLTLVLGLVFASSAAFGQSIVGSSHDFSNGSGNVETNTAQICVFCHVPHGAIDMDAGSTAGDNYELLWNRNLYDSSTGGWSLYAGNFVAANTPLDETDMGPESIACLSCHDGTLGLDSLANVPSDAGAGITITADANSTIGVTNLLEGYVLVGRDMSNDHPVGLLYADEQGTNGDLFANPTDTILFNGKVECGSCHNPHDTTLPSFLRDDPAGSLICLDCHDK